MTYDPIRQFKGYLDFAGKVGLFAVRAARRAVVPPFEGVMIWRGIEEVGWKSLPLVLASGFALGVVLTLHTRSSLVRFGAEAMIPTFQAVAFFNEIGPLVVGLLVAGRVGAGIGASLADMQVTEQIDAIEAFSIDSFKLFVVPRIIACVVSLPILTVFIDVMLVGRQVTTANRGRLPPSNRGASTEYRFPRRNHL
ncbi:MAG: ABC transporter permease [Terriglobales bacterium]|jgi:phospholipid/cholesterol/gamma-HCH transport system permease protein